MLRHQVTSDGHLRCTSKVANECTSQWFLPVAPPPPPTDLRRPPPTHLGRPILLYVMVVSARCATYTINSPKSPQTATSDAPRTPQINVRHGGSCLLCNLQHQEPPVTSDGHSDAPRKPQIIVRYGGFCLLCHLRHQQTSDGHLRRTSNALNSCTLRWFLPVVPPPPPTAGNVAVQE